MNKPFNLIKKYLLLCKPGIIFGNLISVGGGFFLASKGNVDLSLLLATVIGVSLVIASGCVFNNCIDSDIDANMQRTQSRVMVQGIIPSFHAIFYASILGFTGVILLYVFANLLSALLVTFGFVVYVVLYSMWFKRSSVHGTLVGSFSGAMPPVVGYCAVTNNFDLCALILLLMFSLWQMPHSYAIAIFRINDYRAANIPVLPIVCGINCTKKHMVYYVSAFTLMSVALSISGYVGYIYFIATVVTSGYWLWLTYSGYSVQNDTYWARKIFILSIVIITILSVVMAIDYRYIAVNDYII